MSSSNDRRRRPVTGSDGLHSDTPFVVAGLLIGLVATRWLAGFAESQLHEVETSDPGMLAAPVAQSGVAQSAQGQVSADSSSRGPSLLHRSRGLGEQWLCTVSGGSRVRSTIRATVAQPNRRKIYLINPRFQWRFIGFMAAVSLLAIAILFLSNILFFREMRQEALAVGLAPDNPYFDFLAEQQSSLSRVYLGVSAVTFVVMVGLGIVYSHRIAGPLHQLNDRMKQIAQGGDPAPASFRRNDQFRELAESYNAMLAKLTGPPAV